MSNQNDGGPAFPTVMECWGNVVTKDPGMGLRDYFAASALSALLQNDYWLKTIAKNAIETNEGLDDRIAGAAYVMADAMLKAKKGGE